MAFQWWPVQQLFTDPTYWNLWEGLVAAWLPIGRGKVIPEVTGLSSDGVLTNLDPSTDWVVTRHGMAVQSAATGSEHVAMTCTEAQGYPFTMAAWVEALGTQAIYQFCRADGSSANEYIALGTDTNGEVRVAFRNTVDGTENIQGSTRLSTGERGLISLAGRHSTLREVHLNGILEATATASHAGPANLDNVAFGGMPRSSPFYDECFVQAAFIWDRDLSLAELRQLYQADLDWIAFSPIMLMLYKQALAVPVATHDWVTQLRHNRV